MKVKVTKAAIIKALDSTDVDFDLAIIYKLLDKLPTVYYDSLIEGEFFEQCINQPYYELRNDEKKFVKYFIHRIDMVNYCVENKIASARTVTDAIDKRTFRKGYTAKKLFPDNRVSPEIVGSD